MRKTIDALIDIIIIAILVFTAMVTVESVAMRYMLVVVGSGALFNNVKYLYNHFKDNNNTKK
jgi:hypothetical protein